MFFFLADKAYQIRSVPPVLRTVPTVFGVPTLLWLAGGAACSAMALIWLAVSI